MYRPSFVFAALAAAVTLLACHDVPTSTQSLTLEATLSKSTIAIGDSATLTLHLRNMSAQSRELTFGSSCQVLPYVHAIDPQRMTDSGVVYPPSGAYGCLTVITHLSLAPFGEHTVTQTLMGDTSNLRYPAITLPPGHYSAYAVLEPNSEGLELQSAGTPFVVE